MAGTGSGRTYSIKEVAALVGLPPSTLRYYEEVGVIPAIARDPIADMREFVRSGLGGDRDISEFISLLEQQDVRLQEEAQIIELRREFLRTKVEYWRAIKSGDALEAERLDTRARELAERLKLWTPRS